MLQVSTQQYNAPTTALPHYKPKVPPTVTVLKYSPPKVQSATYSAPTYSSDVKSTHEVFEKKPYSFKYEVPEGKYEHEEISDTKKVEGHYDIETSEFNAKTVYSVKQGSGFSAQSSYSINPHK